MCELKFVLSIIVEKKFFHKCINFIFPLLFFYIYNINCSVSYLLLNLCSLHCTKILLYNEIYCKTEFSNVFTRALIYVCSILYVLQKRQLDYPTGSKYAFTR